MSLFPLNLAKPKDLFSREMRDLRISLTDRCNFRCRYCMPIEVFDAHYAFLPKDELLTFEEIVRVAKASVACGVNKIRLTGGEPLMRRGVEDLVAMLACIEGVEDMAMTTNGALLAHHAEALYLAGLHRVTVSLDALDPIIFARMNGVGAKVDRVLAGIEAAQVYGLGVKINAVIQKGVNETEILPLAQWAKARHLDIRFIEYMDVGETNGWKMNQVLSGAEILKYLQSYFPLQSCQPKYRGEVAKRWRHEDGVSEIGLITSVTQPFCGDCQRLRLSADGKAYTCLFSSLGHDLKGLLRYSHDDQMLLAAIGGIWEQRRDRYSEERGRVDQVKAEMSYLGG
jgi:GTP 3',8-cyclase